MRGVLDTEGRGAGGGQRPAHARRTAVGRRPRAQNAKKEGCRGGMEGGRGGGKGRAAVGRRTGTRAGDAGTAPRRKEDARGPRGSGRRGRWQMATGSLPRPAPREESSRGASRLARSFRAGEAQKVKSFNLAVMFSYTGGVLSK